MVLEKNTKGQGMSTSTIILLILGVVVLVVLIMGFSSGWQKIAPWISSTNVDDIVTSCQAACSTNSKYDFCSAPRMLRDAEKNKIQSTCALFSTLDEFKKYGVATCELDCKLPCTQIQVGESKGIVAPQGTLGKYDVTYLANDLTAEQVCVIQ